MRELTHLSLFTGFGGLDLAAEWAGIKTLGQVEWADYPTKVLEKHWPDVPRWRDIRTLTGENFYERTGKRTVDIISGGFPCQPFSVAGKQRGKEDDRYLWPEMVRVIKELRPTWVVGENVAGIVRMELPEILSELEGCGYSTRTFLIPACGVGARHRRYRVAIVGWNTNSRGRNQGQEREMESRENTQSAGICADVGYSEHNGLSATAQPGGIGTAGSRKPEGKEAAGEPSGAGRYGNCKDVANTENQQLYGGMGARSGRSGFTDGGTYVSNADNGSRTVWRDGELPAVEEIGKGRNNNGRGVQEYGAGERREVKPGMGMLADGISTGMGGCVDLDFIINHYWDIEPDIPRVATGIKNRVEKLKGFGNAAVPQQFYLVFKAIHEIETGCTSETIL